MRRLRVRERGEMLQVTQPERQSEVQARWHARGCPLLAQLPAELVLIPGQWPQPAGSYLCVGHDLGDTDGDIARVSLALSIP